MSGNATSLGSNGVLVMDKSKINKPKHTLEERFPEMFAPNRHIDRRKCERTVPMKVLVLGMCRTGTACECAFFVSFYLCSVGSGWRLRMGEVSVRTPKGRDETGCVLCYASCWHWWF